MADKRTTLRAADILDQAADLIETKGWARGAMRTPDGRLCAAAAIAEVSGKSNASPRRAVEAVKEEVGRYIVVWNDSRRSPRTVIATMRRAARKLRESVK